MNFSSAWIKLKIATYSFSSQVKDSLVGAAKSVAQDAKRATEAASQALQDDFEAVGKAFETVKDTGKEQFHAAEAAAHRAVNENRKFIENPFIKATQLAHGAKEKLKDSADLAAQKAVDSAKRAAASAKKSNESVAENVVGKVKGTLSNVKESVTSTSHTTSSNPLNPASSINPMGDTPSREPIDNPEQKGMSKETEELQRKGADRKAEEDSFNLM